MTHLGNKGNRGLQEQRGEGAKPEARHWGGGIRKDFGEEMISKRRQEE